MEPRPQCSSLSTDIRRFKLVVAYDGSDFCGWAAQPEQRTVQSTLKEAIRRATGEESEPVGASRTDSGAHAFGQVAHIDLAIPIPADRLQRALNRALPGDLRIVSSQEVPQDFHSRFCAAYRHYRYQILRDPVDAFRSRYAHLYEQDFKLELMEVAAEFLVGQHDYLAFTEELDDSVENTSRELFSIEISEKANLIAIDVKGTAFLRGMMRRISGFLLEVGRGHRPAGDSLLLLSDRRNETQWPVVLPAKGLTLVEVHYDEPYRDCRNAIV